MELSIKRMCHRKKCVGKCWKFQEHRYPKINFNVAFPTWPTK